MMQLSKNKSFLNWVLKHDECKIFIILYITLAVALSILLSLFWLVLVVFIHFLFEIFKQSFLKNNFISVIIHSFWETKLDIALVLFAICLGIYMDVIFGIAGIGAGTRAIAQAAPKFAVWNRIIRGILISLDDIAQVLRFTKNKKKSIINKVGLKNDNTIKWTAGDFISFSLGIIMLVMIFVSPIITKKSYIEVVNIILRDLTPFP